MKDSQSVVDLPGSTWIPAISQPNWPGAASWQHEHSPRISDGRQELLDDRLAPESKGLRRNVLHTNRFG